jgi:hypothetical protein
MKNIRSLVSGLAAEFIFAVCLIFMGMLISFAI